MNSTLKGEGSNRWTQNSTAVHRISRSVLFGCGTLFDLAANESRKTEIESRMASPGFWDNPDAAQANIQELKSITEVLRQFGGLVCAGDDLSALIQLTEED